MTTTLNQIPGIGPSTVKVLTENGFDSAQQIADTTIAQLSRVPGFGAARASRTIKAANEVLSVSTDASTTATTEATAAQTTIRQRRIAKKPVPKVTRSASATGTDTKVAAATKESEIEEMAKKAKKAALKLAKKAKKEAKKEAKKVKQAAKKVKQAAKKVAKAAKKAAKKAKKKTQSKKNKK